MNIGSYLRRPVNAVITSRDSRSLSRPAEVAAQFLYYLVLTTGLLVLTAPIIVIVGVSFNPTTRQIFPPSGFSLRWYEAFFAYPDFVEGFFFVSLPIAFIVGFLATALGVMAAYFVVRSGSDYESEASTFFLLPTVVPVGILGLALLIFFDRWDFLPAFAKLVLGHTLIGMPFAFLTSVSALRSVDTDLEQAARNLGATRLQAFRQVTLPLMRSGVISGYLLAFILSFSDINIALFLSNSNALTLPLAIFFFLQDNSSPIIAATATLKLLLILVLVLIIGRLVGFTAVVRD
ncbi:ABC transporter permease [Haloglomus litoreum]|uniref:ABC transporter permease n=1 Tax=Haloglomus litoreum TaxID=3034026 RepID=UPI0023E81924|nr:ABC transporter permease [Haloglomus sp. DT116]